MNTTISNVSDDVHSVTGDIMTMKEVVAVVLLALVFVMGVFGNAIVIYVFGWRKRRRRSTYDLLLLLLAVNDLMASTVNPTMFAYLTVTRYNAWHFGHVGCKILPSVLPVSVTCTQGILVLISYERYRSICAPLRHRLNNAIIIAWLIAVVLIGVGIVAPYSYTLEIQVDKAHDLNSCFPNGNYTATLFAYATASNCRDVIVIAIMTSFGVYTSRSMHMSTQATSTLTNGVFSSERRMKNNRKARNILVALVVVFSLCTLPLDVFQCIYYTITNFFKSVQFNATSVNNIMLVNTLLNVLQIANSATNIVIYSRMHRDFKRGLFACAKRSNASFRASFRSSLSRIMTSRSQSNLQPECAYQEEETYKCDVISKQTFMEMRILEFVANTAHARDEEKAAPV